MAKIRDYAITVFSTTTASMVCEMPTHLTGDLLVAFVNKDAASNFTTPGGWTAGQTQTSAGAGGGLYYKRAASASETVTFALTTETCCAVVIAVQNVNGSTEADAVSGSAKSGADDSSLPLTGVGITPGHNNCLIIHGLSTDSGIGANALPPWVNLFAGDTGANSLCVSYSQQKTAAAITAPTHWAGAADDSRGFIIAIRDDGNGDVFDAYLPLTTTPGSQITPLNGVTGAVDKGAYAAVSTPAVTPIAGKTVTGLAVATTADSGINPFRGSMRNAGNSSTTGLDAVSLNLTATDDLTAKQGLVFGTFLNLAPRDYVDTGKAIQGGKYLLIGSTAANYKAWVVGGQFTKTEKADARNNYLIEVASSDTLYDTAGTADMAAADIFMFGAAGYYGAPSILWNELYLLDVVTLAGGSDSSPFAFNELVFVVNNGVGILPLLQQAGALATVWCPLKFGGVDPIFVACDLNTFQFPRKADEIDYVDFHVSNDKIGIEFHGQDRGSGDVDILRFTNCLFTSPSSFYWRFNASHDVDAIVDFTGASVVNANVTLRSTVVLSDVKFIRCTAFAQNNASLSACTFDGTKVTSDNPADISASSFLVDTGHGLEISAAGTYAFVGNLFTGFGPDKQTFHTTTDVDAGTDVVTTDTAHGYVHGDPIIYQKMGGSVAMGLADGTTYFVRAPSTTTLAFYTTQANALADTSRLALTSTGSETHHLYSPTAAIYNNSGGAVTLNVSDGGSTPSVRNANAAANTTTVNNTVTVRVTVKAASDGSVIQDARIYLIADTGGDLSPGTVILSGLSNASGILETTSFNYTNDQPVTGRVRRGTSTPLYKTGLLSGTITAGGFNAAVFLVADE